MSTSEQSGLRCALVGADSLLMECGELLLASGHQIEVVGAGSPRVARWATSKGLTVVDASGPASEWHADLASHPVQWLFAITHLAILPDEVLAIPSEGAVNFHDGPLPSYAGLNTPAWALLRGEETYGVTWHAITAGIDEGDILEQRLFDIAPGETSLSLNTRNFATAIESFEALVGRLAAGTAVASPQDPSVPRATFSRNDRPDAMVVLDWRQPADQLDRIVRALTFGPYPNPLGFAKVQLDHEFVLVTEAEVAPDIDAPPGHVVEVGEDRLVVATADGGLLITAITSQTGAALAVTGLGLVAGDVLPIADDAQRDEWTSIGAAAARSERHHLRQLQSLEPVEIPWARTPQADHEARFASMPVEVPATITDAPDAVATAFLVLLSRLSGKERFHVAVVDPAQTSRLAAAVPLLAPSVPLEVRVDSDEDLAAATARMSQDLHTVRSLVPPTRELVARHPDLVAVPELASGRALPVAIGFASGPPLEGVVVELQETAEAPGTWQLRYDEVLVDEADARLLAACLSAVLGELAANPSRPVAKVDLLGSDLRRQVLDTWNTTDRELPTGVAVHHLFERQVDATPDVDAVVFEDRTCTYRELDERANRLAHHLIELGVGPDHLVGVHVTRGLDLVVSVLAVHKAGGAYVPLDPVYPRDRLAHMIRDSGARVILTEASVGATLPERDNPSITVVTVDADQARIDAHPATRPAVDLPESALAYCIYTSGSTGLPKGVLVEHRNAVNFFVGMDERVPHDLPATWFAVTSLSFDISVLELLYTLTRGFTVVVYLDRERAAGTETTQDFVEKHAQQSMGFSLFYFSGDAADGHGSQKYRLLLEGARFADEHGFEAVWTPERHFHAFGGLYPQPAVTGAAVAAITKNVHIRAGSVVMPLHHPIRVAEAWSIVDNLSDGRVGVSVASGWQPNDFVLMPENYARAKDVMFESLDEVKRLWRGEAVTFPGATDEPVTVTTLPRPVQPELPVWVTSAGNPETYIQAGRIGANVLTHLLGQSVEQLAPKIEAYRQARAEAGFDPDSGRVTLMLHTFVGDDDDEVRSVVREPLKEYLGTSFNLLKEYAWSFPAFQRPEGDEGGIVDEDFKSLSDEDLDAVLEFAFERYYETSGLFGNPDRCRRMVDQLKGIGVSEIACLVDFGVATDTVLDSLDALDRVRQLTNPAEPGTSGPPKEAEPAADQSVAAQLARHGVTHLQCTPSMARMWSLQDDSREALAKVENLFIGGEAFPTALARDLMSASRSGLVTNMYGPTETTIWSTTWPLHGDLATIPIGSPIANTRIYILDAHLEPVPPGVAGDLWIGGAGVVRGYHERPELTAERFVADPFRGEGHRMYLTGDLARWVPDDHGSARLDFLGRADHQVKIRGYRIELGEIEAQLGRYAGVVECVAVVREDTPGDQQLVAYLSPASGVDIDPASVKAHLRETLPDVMIPGHVVVLEDLPHTPNGKIDRNGLPSLAEVAGARVRSEPAAEAGNDLERQVLAVWEEILGTTGIGVNDNFFDIGGHSLLAVRLHRRLRAELDRTFPLTEVYRHPTVRSFAASMDSDTFAAVIEGSKDRAARRRESLDRRRARR